jgi:hypothetical protein
MFRIFDPLAGTMVLCVPFRNPVDSRLPLLKGCWLIDKTLAKTFILIHAAIHAEICLHPIAGGLPHLIGFVGMAQKK